MPCNTHITIYIITGSVGIKSYISKFSQEKCSILSFYCTVLFTGCSAKKTLKNLLHRERLLITQETLRISLFAFMFLSLVKKTTLHFLFTALPYAQGALQKRRLWNNSSQRISNEKLRNIVDIGIQSYVTKFSQKCFILSVYCSALCTERFKPLRSLSTSKKKLGHITNINIWSYKFKCSEKTVLYFHFTALCYVQGARKKLKIASFIEHAERFRMHITIINIPWYPVRFGKEKCFILTFFTLLLLQSYVQGTIVMNLWTTSIEHDKEKLGSATNIGIQ